MLQLCMMMYLDLTSSGPGKGLYSQGSLALHGKTSILRTYQQIFLFLSKFQATQLGVDQMSAHGNCFPQVMINFLFINLIEIIVKWGEGTSTEELRPSQTALRASLWNIFLINGWCARVQPTLGSSASRQVVLGVTREQPEQAMRSKSISSVLPWSLLQFQPWDPASVSINNGF